MYGYIYKTTNLVNGKIYIGKHVSKTFDSWYKGSGVKLYSAMKHYGESNFKVELIEECQDEETLNERERHWIATLQTQDSTIGYNLADGGKGGWSHGIHAIWYGRHHSEKTKQKLSESVKKSYDKYPELRELRKMWGQSNKGTHMSEETKLKISNTLKGRKTSNKQKEAARQAMNRRWKKYHKEKEKQNGKNRN